MPCQSEVRSTCKKTKILFGKLGKIISRCVYFVHCTKYQNSCLRNPISVWSSLISKDEPRGKVRNKFRSIGKTEERWNSTVRGGRGERGEFLNNLFLVNKKDSGHIPVISLKFLSSFSYFTNFRNGRNAFNKETSRGKQLFDKDGPIKCLFWHTSQQKLKKIIILLDDMLVMTQTLKGKSPAKKILISLLQNLRFVINFSKLSFR